MMTIYLGLGFISILLIFLFGYFSIILGDLRAQIAELQSLLGYEEFIVDEEEVEGVIDTLDEEEALFLVQKSQAQKEFEERIQRIKEELAISTPTKPTYTTIADELHPMVKNLPHDSIALYETNPPEEYSE